LFSDSQFGFRAGRSTITAVSLLVDRIVGGFESSCFTGVTLCDLSKAFDTVDHSALLSKLKYYGIKDSPLQLFESYLVGREQIVSVNGQNSQAAIVRHGVPQGSVLGPLLFIIMMNDLHLNLPNEVICYADDTSLVCNSRDILNLENAMSDSLNRASGWFQANYFLLNESKTQSMIFTLKQINQDVDSVKLLGITLDSKLSWSQHIADVCSRLSRVIYLLRNLKKCIPVMYLKNCYFAFFQGTFLYGLELWGGASDVEKVLLLQKKAIRILCDEPFDAHCKPLFIRENIMTIFSMYVYRCLLSAKKDLDQLTLRGSVHSHNTRFKYLIDLPMVRLSKTQKSSAVLKLKLFNVLPCTAWTQTFSKFKSNTRTLLLANPIYSIKEFYEIPSESVSKAFA